MAGKQPDFECCQQGQPKRAYHKNRRGMLRHAPEGMMKPMSKRPRWTAEEEEYLAENWGTLAIPTLARNLGRSEDAVVIRARRLGLGPFLDSGDYVSFNQLLVAVTGGNSGYGYKIKSWVENRGFPLHYKRVGSQRWRIVYLKEFWKWAEKNRAFIDFSRMEPLALGEEPEWVAEQRRKDFETFALQRKDPWTSEEDSRLIMLLKQQRYGYAELSQMLRRSAGAIQRRCGDLGIKERPVKADTHGDSATTVSVRPAALPARGRHSAGGEGPPARQITKRLYDQKGKTRYRG